MTSATGKIERIYIATNKKEPVQQIERASLEAGKGIVGDRYHALSEASLASGKPGKENHLSLIAREELDDFLTRHDSDLDYGDFRRSIITSGIDLNSLVGKKFKLGTALCLGAELCEPCAFLASSVHRSVLPELVHKSGLRAVIVNDGEIQTGDSISAD